MRRTGVDRYLVTPGDQSHHGAACGATYKLSVACLWMAQLAMPTGRLDGHRGPRFPKLGRRASRGDGGMVYVVRAINVDGVTGTFTAEKNTRVWVIIIGPDGKPLDETKENE